jgi:hypothetical protein
MVEHTVRIPGGRQFKRDLLGCIDVVACTPSGILGIQATVTAAHHAHRRIKMLAEPRLAAWVASGGLLELWSWSKRGARGKAKRWALRTETYQQMQEAA